jgi:hypothetical protein
MSLSTLPVLPQIGPVRVCRPVRAAERQAWIRPHCS